MSTIFKHEAAVFSTVTFPHEPLAFTTEANISVTENFSTLAQYNRVIQGVFDSHTKFWTLFFAEDAVTLPHIRDYMTLPNTFHELEICGVKKMIFRAGNGRGIIITSSTNTTGRILFIDLPTVRRRLA